MMRNVTRAKKNGADGYVLKDISPDQLILTVKSVFKGYSIMHQSTLNTFIDSKDKEKKNKKTSANIKKEKVNVRLGKRELEILNLIVEGKNNKEIAETMFISEGTVKNTISHMLIN